MGWTSSVKWSTTAVDAEACSRRPEVSFTPGATWKSTETGLQ